MNVKGRYSLKEKVTRHERGEEWIWVRRGHVRVEDGVRNEVGGDRHALGGSRRVQLMYAELTLEWRTERRGFRPI